MKIGLFTECYLPVVNGVVYCVENIRNTLKNDGHQVFTFAPSSNKNRAHESDVYTLKSFRLGKTGYFFTYGFNHEMQEAASTCDVLHTHHPFAMARNALKISKKYKILNSPLYLKFLKGERYLKCTPWGNPTRNYLGWKSPCYLITDTHYKTFDECMERTDWDKYQEGNDPRCKNCMMHCGFEPTVVLGGGKRLSDIIEMAKWSFS